MTTTEARQLGLFDPPRNEAYEEYMKAYRAAYRELARIQSQLVLLESERAEWRGGKRPVKLNSPAYVKRTRTDAGRLLALVTRLEQVTLAASGGQAGQPAKE